MEEKIGNWEENNKKHIAGNYPVGGNMNTTAEELESALKPYTNGNSGRYTSFRIGGMFREMQELGETYFEQKDLGYMQIFTIKTRGRDGFDYEMAYRICRNCGIWVLSNPYEPYTRKNRGER